MKRILFLGLLFFLFLSTAAGAATITVTNTNDFGVGSLRQAIVDASAGDTIDFAITGTITLSSQLTIGKNLTITGPGSDNLSISGNNFVRVFLISSSSVVTIKNITLKDGRSASYGGGIENEGTLTIENCSFQNCSANGSGNGYGGAVDNYRGDLLIKNSVFTANSATNNGGAISCDGGSADIIDSSFTNNSSSLGGAIAQVQGQSGNLTIKNSTINANSASLAGSKAGGGLSLYNGVVNLENTTISDNTADEGGAFTDGIAGLTVNINACTIINNTGNTSGGGIWIDAAIVNIKNSILAANTSADGANLKKTGGTFNSLGYNLCDSALADFNGTGDLTNATLNIGALADNGGNTKTHALQAGSDAIDAIPEGGNNYNGIPATDQLGTARPQGTNADIGAFEKISALTVTTQAVNSISTSTATGNGTITSLGSANPTAHGVCWNTTGNPTTADSKTDEGGTSSTGAFTTNITGLSPNTTYYVKAYAINTGGTSYGSQVSFTTNAVPPTITTQAVSGVGTTTATGNGNITAFGSANPTAHGVCWNTTGTPTTADSKTNEGVASSTGAFTTAITGLSASTTYYVRAYAVNTGGTSYGSQVSFTTSAVPPTITTQAVSGIGTTTATGNGNITALGSVNPTAHGVCWNTTGSPTTSDSKTDEGAASSTGAFTTSITGLSANTTYYVRAYAVNSGGTSYGVQVSFKTNPVAPTITTQAVTGIGTTTATGNGNITDLGAPNPTVHGVCWNTTGTPTTSDYKTDKGASSSTGAFTTSITGLSLDTTYYLRAYAVNSGGTAYGAQVSFKTLSDVPATITTQTVTGIGATTATGNGNITDLGVPNPTAYGVCWNTSGTPTIADNKTDKGGASSTGTFTTSITGLTANTTYYVRAYAVNSGGTSYGAQVSFTTNAVLPAITTQAVTGVGKDSATGNGNITDLGAPNPTSHGVCWNDTGNPTIADSKTDEGAASSTGAFSTAITGLNPGTKYYVRSYATNVSGTVYGEEQIFNTVEINLYSLNIKIKPDGAGSVLGSLGSIDCANKCSKFYTDGIGVTLTPKANEYYKFTGWTGSFNSLDESLSVFMTKDQTLTANFEVTIPYADLAVTISADSYKPTKDSLVTFTIKANNNGPDDARGVGVSAFLPSGLSYMSDDGVSNYSPSSGKWNIGDLESGGSATLHIVAKVNDSREITESVSISSTSPKDINTSNNKALFTIGSSKPQADMGIFSSVSPKTGVAGDIITWTMSVINNGPDNANNVILSADIPSELGSVKYKISGSGAFKPWSGILDLGNMNQRELKTIWIKGVVSDVEKDNKLSLQASISALELDPSMGDNSSSTSLSLKSVKTSSDLGIVMGITPSDPGIGDIVSFSIIVTNNGSDNAEDIKVRNLIPYGMSFESYSGDGEYSPSTGIWNIGSLINGSSASMILNARVDIKDIIIHKVYVDSLSLDDPVFANNSAAISLNSKYKKIDLALEGRFGATGNFDASALKTGDRFDFNLDFTNNGTGQANGAQVKVNIPTGMALKGFRVSSGCFDESTYIWHIDDPDACGEQRFFTCKRVFKKRADDSATLTLELEVSDENKIKDEVITANILNHDPDDPDTTNNSTSQIINNTEDFNTDLAVSIYAGSDNIEPGEDASYVVLVRNNGPDTASGVMVNVELADGFTYKAFFADKGLFDGDTGIWTIENLSRGDGCFLKIEISSNETPGDKVTTASILSASENDINKENDKSTAKIVAGKSYTLNFIAGENGSLAGDLTQTISSGGSSSSVTAVADEGYLFINWSGDYEGINNPLILNEINSDMTITPIFTKKEIADSDGDGIADIIEQGPSGTDESYDGNGDGVADKNQVDVVSLGTIREDGYVTITTNPGKIASVSIETSNDSIPDGYEANEGLFTTKIKDLSKGDTAEIKFIFNNVTGEPDSAFAITGDGTWSDPDYGNVSGSVTGYTCTDGGLGDNDKNIDSYIILKSAPGWKKKEAASDDSSSDCFIGAVSEKSQYSLFIQLFITVLMLAFLLRSIMHKE